MIFGTILAIIIGLTCMFVIGTLNMPSDSSYEQQLSAQRVSDEFDKNPTIASVNKLKFSDQTENITLPTSQRINPFLECYDKNGNLLTVDFAKCYDQSGNLIYQL